MREGLGAASQHGEAFFQRAHLLKLLRCAPKKLKVPRPPRVKPTFLQPLKDLVYR